MITVEEALDRILSSISPLGLEKVDILNTLGRVLGEDIYADMDIPPNDNSAMDGYALCSGDTQGASREDPAMLNVLEDIPAGCVPQKCVNPGEASRIMTGASIPEGADAIMRVEETEKAGKMVKIFAEAVRGQDIRFAGEDVKDGELVISRGNIIRPAAIGMMASLGRSFVYVHQRPLIAILTTGDELVDVDGVVSPGKIRNSNSYSIAAQVMDCGGIPLQIGMAKDTREDLIAKFKAAMRADIIISSGGVSVGDYDLVKDVMSEVGNSMEFWQVAMRPGKPLACGTIEDIPTLGLPGNPVSSMVSFEQFVRPAILKLMGHKKLFRKAIKAILKEDIKKKRGFRHFIRAQIRHEDGKITALTTGEQGSGILKSMVRANGLIVLPEDIAWAKTGDEVTVQLIDNSLELTTEPEYLTDPNPDELKAKNRTSL